MKSRSATTVLALAVLQGLGGVGGPLLVSRHLGPQEFGALTLAMVFGVVVRSVAAMGLYGVVSAMVHNRADVTGSYGLIRSYARWSLPLAALCASVAMVASGRPGLVMWAASSGILGALALLLQSLLRSTGATRSFAIVTLTTTLVANAGGVVAVRLAQNSATAYMAAFTGVSLLGVLAGLVLPHESRRLDRREWRDAVKFGHPLVWTALATTGLALVDRPLVGGLAGNDDLGRYSLLYLVVGGSVPLIGGLANAWLPQVLAAAPDERTGVLNRSTRRYVHGFSAIAAAAAMIGPLAVVRIGGPRFDFSGIGATGALVALATPAYVVYSAATIALVGREQPGKILRATGAGVATSVIATVLLVPLMGLAGAGAASTLGYAVTAGIGSKAASLTREAIGESPLWLWSAAVVIGLCIVLPSTGALSFGRMVALPAGLWGAMAVLRGGQQASA